MQAGNNTIRPTSGDGNGIWLATNSNSESPQPPQILYTSNGNTSTYKKKSKRRLERLLIAAGLTIFVLLLGLCISVYFVAEMGERSNVCLTPECIKAAAILMDSIDVAVNPCDDFYTFACGKWRKTHPASEPLFVNNWFQESLKVQRRDSIDYLDKEDSEDEPRSVHEARIVYRTCMDFDSMEEHGLPTLWELFDKIGLRRNPLNGTNIQQPIIRILAKARRYLGADLLIGSGVLPSLRNSSYNSLVLAIPEDEQRLPGYRTRWRWDDKILREKFKEKVRDEGENIVIGWKKHATKLIEYVIKASDNTTEVTNEQINDAAYLLLDIQRELLLLEENEKVKDSSNNEIPEVLNLGKLQTITNNATASGKSPLDWKKFFEAIYEDINDERMEFEESEPVMVYNVPYIEQLAELIDGTDDSTIELLVWWNVIYAVAPHINEDMKELKEMFVKKILDIPISNSRKEVCSDTVTTLMQSAVGYQVKQYASTNITDEVVDMINHVRGSFANYIHALGWMDDATKMLTVEKLYSMNMYIGYPQWYDDIEIMTHLYSNVTLKNDTHLQNILNLLNEELYEELMALDYVNTLSGDFFDPLDVNAYYDTSSNSITVPYGILQRPYFRMGLRALNYGGLGTVLGHEITHGLDNTGRMFDKDGNYRTWWSNQSSTEYSKREKCYEDMYSKFYVESIEVNVDGTSTLGENIADDGGMRDSFAAYRSHVKKHGKESKLPGFSNYTHDQLFFLSFANMWCAEYSDDALSRTVEEDEHSPNFVRVTVVLQNIREFSEAWSCPIGSYMNPEQKCNLWI